jgi:ferredoxin
MPIPLRALNPIFRLPLQVASFAVHRLGIFRKLPDGWHAEIPRTSAITCGLNCQACELAWLACPTGMLQRYVIDKRFPFYVLGFLVLFGVTIGRWACGWLCPMGLVLDVVNRGSKHSYTPPEWMRFIKYFFLGGLVVLAFFTSIIFFCRYLCFGAVLGIIPYWLTWQTVSYVWLFYHLGAFSFYLTISYFVHGRAWCRYFCPLGAALSLPGVFSMIKLRYNWMWCTKCDMCKKVCPMGIDPTKASTLKNRLECIKCGRCAKKCPNKCLAVGPAPLFNPGKEEKMTRRVPVNGAGDVPKEILTASRPDGRE